jgi:membrane-associated protein
MIDPQSLLDGAGPWAIALVCLIAFVETGLLIGFFLPGDTLLFFTGVFVATGVISLPVPLVILMVAVSAFLGDQLGFVIGRATGPRIFERKDSGLFSRSSVARTQSFFDRFGGWAVTIARFVPVVRTFAPVAAGVGKMHYAHFVGFNALGAAVWSTGVILLGFFLGQIPGVADFVGKYIDIVLVGIVVISLAGIALTYWRQRNRARRDA